MMLPVQLLVFDAVASLRAGDAQAAISLQQEMALWIKRHLAGGDGTTSVEVATHSQEMVADLGCRVLALGNPDAGQWETMDRLWREDPLIAQAWQSAIRRNGAFLRSVLDQVQSEEGEFRGTWREKLFLRKNRTFNVYHEALRKVASVPFQPFPSLEAAWQAGYGKLQRDRSLLGRWDPNATGERILSSLGGSGTLALSQYKALFIPRAMRVRLAVHRWRQAHPGQWPASLAELVPDFLAEVPQDPWNGAPLLWDQAARTVYAVGADWIPDPPVFLPKDRGWVASDANAPGLRMELPHPASAAPVAPAGPAANTAADTQPGETEQ